MYFWNIEKLKEELAKAPLNQKQTLNYLVAVTIIYGLGTIPFGSYNQYDVFASALVIPVTIIGVYWAYYSNGGDEGQDFLSRYMAISWVMMVRLIVFLIPTIFIGVILLSLLSGQEPPEHASIVDVVVIVTIEVFYYWRVAVHMKPLDFRFAVE